MTLNGCVCVCVAVEEYNVWAMFQETVWMFKKRALTLVTPLVRVPHFPVASKPKSHTTFWFQPRGIQFKFPPLSRASLILCRSINLRSVGRSLKPSSRSGFFHVFSDTWSRQANCRLFRKGGENIKSQIRQPCTNQFMCCTASYGLMVDYKTWLGHVCLNDMSNSTTHALGVCRILR